MGKKKREKEDGKDKEKKKSSKKDHSPELADQVFKTSDSNSESKSSFFKKEKKNPNSKWSRFVKFITQPVSLRKFLLITGSIFILALLLIGADFYFSFGSFSSQSHFAYPQPKEPEVELDTPSPLTGVMTTEAKANQAVVAAMIENHTASRPQSGLSKADLVYEAVVEGGITRFLAFYLTSDAEEIGPIRSARSYYLPWVKEIDAFYAHVGGSEEALDLIPEYDLKDLDQFYNSRLFDRVSFKASPHNVYSSPDRLRKGGAVKGWPSSNNFTSWEFKDSEPTEKKATKRININYSGDDFAVQYRWDNQDNLYQRYLAGLPHKDRDGSLVKARNVLIQVTDQGLNNDGQHMDVEVIGSGKAYLFRDGRVFIGSWRKESVRDRTKFYLDSGKPFKLARGKTWVQVVGSQNVFSY